MIIIIIIITLDLFERRIDGLLDLLDEEARLPKPSSYNFTLIAHQRLKNHFRLSVCLFFPVS